MIRFYSGLEFEIISKMNYTLNHSAITKYKTRSYDDLATWTRFFICHFQNIWLYIEPLEGLEFEIISKIT